MILVYFRSLTSSCLFSLLVTATDIFEKSFQVNYTHNDDDRVRLLGEEEARIGSSRDSISIPSYVGQSEALQYQGPMLKKLFGPGFF